MFAVASVEKDQPVWMDANRDWIRRAERGTGVAGGPDRTRTSYFYNNGFRPYGASWGAVVVKGSNCGEPSPSPTCYPIPTPDPSGVIPSFEIPSPSASGDIAALPCPTPSAAPVREPVGQPVRGGADTDAGGDTDADAGGDPDADARADADADARRPTPTPTTRAAVPPAP